MDLIVPGQVDAKRIDYLIHQYYTVERRHHWLSECEADIYREMFLNWNGSIDDLIREKAFKKRERGYYEICYSSSSERILWQSPEDISQEELDFLRRIFKEDEERFLTKYFSKREKVSWREVDEKYEERRRIRDEKKKLANAERNQLNERQEIRRLNHIIQEKNQLNERQEIRRLNQVVEERNDARKWRRRHEAMTWVNAIKRTVAPVPLTVGALLVQIPSLFFSYPAYADG
jgi:lipopolysaccharide export LptBFGC system permease protein LptF